MAYRDQSHAPCPFHTALPKSYEASNGPSLWRPCGAGHAYDAAPPSAQRKRHAGSWGLSVEELERKPAVSRGQGLT
jgi:hypothetical protein